MKERISRKQRLAKIQENSNNIDDEGASADNFNSSDYDQAEDEVYM